MKTTKCLSVTQAWDISYVCVCGCVNMCELFVRDGVGARVIVFVCYNLSNISLNVIAEV